MKREKQRVWLLTILYRIHKLLPGTKWKLKFYLNLEWIFNRLAMEMAEKYYTGYQHPRKKHTADIIKRFINSESSVLDLGCYNGDILNLLSPVTQHLYGVDTDRAAIQEGKSKYPDIHFSCEDLFYFMPKQENGFDVLILSHVLEHMDDPEQFLMQYKKHFKFMYIEVPDFDKLYLNHHRMDLGLSLNYTDPDHINEFNREDLAALLQNCGIEIIKAEYRFAVQKLWCKVR